MKGLLLKSGDMIGGRYEIGNFLGAGGMQEVYLARDRVLERDTALKVPKNAASERRFQRSAILSAKVNHPNAAKTLDYVEEGDRFYLIEEFISGRDLSKIRTRMPMMDPYLVAHILHHLAKGIAASHHVGIVHRDLKPSNVMLSGDFSFKVVKITDFGIAKMAHAEFEEVAEKGEDSLTSSSTVMGALPYLSPEMISSPKTADKPADVWAAGAMAYELLTGQKPFGRGLQAVEKIRREPLPELPPVCLEKTQFRPLVQEIYSIVKKCLEKEASERPTADQLIQSCEMLCYPDCVRSIGRVGYQPEHRRWGFVSVFPEDVFFHVASVYGGVVSVGDEVCYTPFPGNPKPRAHPVIKLAAQTVARSRAMADSEP